MVEIISFGSYEVRKLKDINSTLIILLTFLLNLLTPHRYLLDEDFLRAVLLVGQIRF